MDEYLETQWEKLQQGEKALLTTYRTLDQPRSGSSTS
jgi:hypothetical protein